MKISKIISLRCKTFFVDSYVYFMLSRIHVARQNIKNMYYLMICLNTLIAMSLKSGWRLCHSQLLYKTITV